MTQCWCGNQALVPWNDDYRRCPACESLVFAREPAARVGRVDDDERDFYGQDYWFGHQDALGLPDIWSRARTDFVDRIPQWMQTVLRYVEPPGRALELGCSHGGFVAALSAAGFDASGLELSPAIAAVAREAFDIDILTGPIEAQAIAPGSVDLLVAMDVLEHLPDPVGTMRASAAALAQRGVMVLQTPRYEEGASYESLRDAGAPFLSMLLPNEHLFLFSRQAVRELLARVGLHHVTFEPAVFAHYDMCVLASREPLKVLQPTALTGSARARLVQSMIDLDEARRAAITRLVQAEADASARLQSTEYLQRLLESEQAESRARADQIETLTGLLAEANTDREARLRNANTLEALLQESRIDATARLEQVTQLQSWLVEARGECDAARASLVERDNELARVAEESRRLLALLEQARVELANAEARTDAARTITRAGRTASTRAPLIAIDLTPILPGSENGGAKGLVLSLLDMLRSEPAYRYLLLTSRANHESFAQYEKAGMRRLCVDTPAAARMDRLGRVGRLLSRGVQRLQAVAGRGALASEGVRLLFCPMTDPVRAEPGIPVVSLLYDLQHLTYPMFFAAEELANRDAFYTRLKRQADAIVCISEFTRQDAIAKLQIAPERAFAVPIAVHGRLPAVQPADVARVRDAYGLGTAPYALYPANGWAHKNHRVLLVAFARLLRDRPDSDLHLVLTGNLLGAEADLRHAIEEMGLTSRVRITGYVPEQDLGPLWFDAFCLVYPSLFEGFGIPLLEAMRYGVPVICSNVTSLPEVAADAALLVDPRQPATIAEALGELLDKPELRFRLIAAGRRRVAEFTADQMGKRYLSIFEQVLASAGDVPEPRIAGVFGDRWLAPHSQIRVGSGASGRVLTLEVEMPDWHPLANAVLRVAMPGTRRQAVKIARGERRSVVVSLPRAPVTVTVATSPSFVPGGEDQRDLTVQLVRGSVCTSGGDLLHEF